MDYKGKTPKVKLGSNGIWYAQPYLGLTANGKQIRPRKSFPDASDKAEAQAMAADWIASLAVDGKIHSPYLADMLDEYISVREARDIEPNTARQWRMFNRAYIRPLMRGRFTNELTSHDVAILEDKLLCPKERGGRGLSRSTVSNVHAFLSTAYDRWVSAGICRQNPVAAIHRPAAQKHEAVALSSDDMSKLSHRLASDMERIDAPDDSAQTAAYAMGAWLSLHTGMRRGEACAVRRMDVSTLFHRITVRGNVICEKGAGPVRRGSTKNHKPRNIAITEREADVIVKFEEAQTARNQTLGSESPLVTVDGSLINPDDLSRYYAVLRKELSLDWRSTFHSLRHTHATTLLQAGVDVKTVSERLGHADPAMTLRVYAHVMPGRDAEAARVFESLSEQARPAHAHG